MPSHVPLSEVSKYMGQVVTFYLFGGNQVTGVVDGISSGLVFILQSDEIEIIGVERIEVH